MSAQSAATGLEIVPVPKAPDPLRAALRRSRRAQQVKLAAVQSGFDPTRKSLPNIPTIGGDDFDEQAALAAAVQAQAAIDAMLVRRPRAVRAAKFQGRLWAGGRNT